MPPDEAYLRDILDSARLAIQYLAGLAWESFARNVQVQDSVICRIEVIGEAVFAETVAQCRDVRQRAERWRCAAAAAARGA